MLELISVLAVLVIVLGVVALVGHGIWMLLEAILGATTRRAKDSTVCVFCGRKTSLAQSRCKLCGRDLHGEIADELRDLQAVARQLRRWGRSGRLTPRTIERLIARIQRYRQELMHPAPEQPLATQPVAQPAETPKAPPATRAPVAAEVLVASLAGPADLPTDGGQAAIWPAPAAPPVPTMVPPAIWPPAPAVQPVPPPPLEPPPPQRSWSEMLAGFMEERNIRWGELIGGLLIVGPAIALVISFWDKLAANPYLQLTTFVASCSAVFGAGLYAHHRWKLRSTSLGLLIIAMLLVPLNFLAMAAVWKENWGPGTLAADVLSLAIFLWLGGLAGRVLVPNGRWLQAIAVVGGSASVLVAARWVSPHSPDWWYVTAALLPVVLFGAAVGAYVVKLPGRKRMDAAAVATLYTLLGTGFFALLIALGMMIVRSAGIAPALSRLAVPAALAGMPLLACGLTVRRGVARDPTLSGWHVSGTAIALVGMVVMLAALGLAWPYPLAIVAVAAVNCVALVLAAFRWRLPVLNAGAIACATLAYLIGFHVVYSGLPLLGGDSGPMAALMLRQIISASSGTAMVFLFVLYAAAAELLARRGQHRHAVIYAGGSGVMALLGLMLAAAHGWQGGPDAVRAAFLSTIYGAGGLAAAARWRRVELSYLGLGLLTVAPLWVLWENPARHHVEPLWAAVLAAEALAMAALAAVLARLVDIGRVSGQTAADGRGELTGAAEGSATALYRVPLLKLAEIAASVALILGVWTAWRDWEAILAAHSLAMVAATVCTTACYLLLAWQYRSPERTWAGSMVALAGLIHAAVWNYPDLVQQPWLMALLTHSTLATLASLLVGEWGKRRATDGSAGELRRVFAAPLGDTAVLSSLLTVPVLPFVSWPSTESLAGCLYWLSAIWLAIGWRRRHALLFAAHQFMLAAATGVATTAWLKRQSWVVNLPDDLWHPYSLQAYGIALGVLSLLWIVARIALRDNATAKKLLDPARPTVDWVLRHALVAAQLMVAVFYLLPGVGQELVRGLGVTAGFQQLQQASFGGGAWLLLGVLAMVLIAALWDHWRRAELTSSLLVAATVPCLVAGRFAGDLAAASALRWGLAVCFLVLSAAIWGRKRLLHGCRLAHAGVDLDSGGRLAAHCVTLATTALPVLALTVVAAAYQFGGITPGGPAANTLFDRLGTNVSYLVPLALVVLAMVGHAIRESSAGYAFSAGLVAELAVTLGYALSVVLAGRPFAVRESATLLQLVTITAVAWALGWLAARRWVDVWREHLESELTDSSSLPASKRELAKSSSARGLMNVQLGMGIAGNAVLIGSALFVLVWWPLIEQDWTIAVGRPLGWLALAGSVAAVGWRLVQRDRRHALGNEGPGGWHVPERSEGRGGWDAQGSEGPGGWHSPRNEGPGGWHVPERSEGRGGWDAQGSEGPGGWHSPRNEGPGGWHVPERSEGRGGSEDQGNEGPGGWHSPRNEGPGGWHVPERSEGRGGSEDQGNEGPGGPEDHALRCAQGRATHGDGRLSANAVGLIGMTAVGLLACTICWWLHIRGFGVESAVWGYRALMLGWAAYALCIVSALWWLARPEKAAEKEDCPQLPERPAGADKGDCPLMPERPAGCSAHKGTVPFFRPDTLLRAAAVWVRLSGVLAVLLGLKAAFLPYGHEERLWAAAAIAIASSAGATMAVWCRREGWAFSAALGVNLAASLVVWYVHRDVGSFDEWWLHLVEANVIASAAVALAWLAAQKRLYQGPDVALHDTPFLATQVALPLAGMIALLAMPVVWLAGTPDYLPAWLVHLSDAAGWLALLLAAAAAAWYLARVLPGKVFHVAAGGLLGIGVLTACHVGRFNQAPGTNDWLAYHTLTVAWASAALLVLGLARLIVALQRRAGFQPAKTTADWQSAPPSRSIVQGWATAIGTAVVALAVMHVFDDRAGAWWPIGAIGSISVAAALLALWFRLPAYVFISGLLLNVAGMVGWVAWGSATLESLVQVNVVCLAAGSAAWTLLDGLHPAGVPHGQLRHGPLPFAHLAALAAVGLLEALTAAGVVAELFRLADLRLEIGRIDWLALGAAAAAVALCLWDRKAQFVPAGLYFLGLSAAGMAMCAAHLDPLVACWRAALALPAFALSAAALGWLLPRVKPVGRLLRIPDAPDRWPVEWLMWAQAVLLATSAALAAWVSLDAAFDAIGGRAALLGLAGRPAADLGGLLLLAAVVAMAAQQPGANSSRSSRTDPAAMTAQAGAPWRSRWQNASLAAGVLPLCCLGWASLDLTIGTPSGDAPWLHRSIILMAALVPPLLLGGLGLRWMVRKESDWIAAGRRMTPILGGLALLALAALLVQERILYVPGAAPAEARAGLVAMISPWIAPWAVAVVVAAMLGLVAACLACALTPRWDPLRLTDRGRTAYVYAAEGLLALICLHLRITVPGLFALHIIRTYWMLIVMIVAFCGAGLSVLFHRRRMPVLSEPLERTALFLPILPPIGCLFIKSYAHAGTWFLGNSGPAFWLLMGLFYGVMAVRKRSLGLAALGVVTGNMGLWVLWHRCGWDFVEFPQLWLIPLALAVLVAEHLDRRRLSEPQRAAIRYLALSVIYVSSTTEFWRHIGQSAVLPLVTILLALLGVLAGILLRVRCFLYLGFTFLMVVIGRMIVYAAFEQRHIWIFWTCCIILGAAIIGLFAVFEKRRNDVLAAVERFRQWDR